VSKTYGRPRKVQDGEEISSIETQDKNTKVFEEGANPLSKQDCKISCDVTAPAPPPHDIPAVPTASSPAAEVANQVEESKNQVAETAIDMTIKEPMEQVAHKEAANAGEENTEQAEQQPAKKRARAASKKPMTADADLSRDPSTPTMADMKEPCSSNNDDTEVANAGEENQEDAKQQPAKKTGKGCIQEDNEES